MRDQHFFRPINGQHLLVSFVSQFVELKIQYKFTLFGEVVLVRIL